MGVVLRKGETLLLMRLFVEAQPAWASMVMKGQAFSAKLIPDCKIALSLLRVGWRGKINAAQVLKLLMKEKESQLFGNSPQEGAVSAMLLEVETFVSTDKSSRLLSGFLQAVLKMVTADYAILLHNLANRVASVRAQHPDKQIAHIIPARELGRFPSRKHAEAQVTKGQEDRKAAANRLAAEFGDTVKASAGRVDPPAGKKRARIETSAEGTKKKTKVEQADMKVLLKELQKQMLAQQEQIAKIARQMS